MIFRLILFVAAFRLIYGVIKGHRVGDLTGTIAGLVSLIFIGTIVLAVMACPRCTGPANDVYMLPFMLSPFGIWGIITYFRYKTQ